MKSVFKLFSIYLLLIGSESFAKEVTVTAFPYVGTIDMIVSALETSLATEARKICPKSTKASIVNPKLYFKYSQSSPLIGKLDLRTKNAQTMFMYPQAALRADVYCK